MLENKIEDLLEDKARNERKSVVLDNTYDLAETLWDLRGSRFFWN
jgi:hypothetical protein